MFVSGKPFQTSLMFVGTLEWSTLKVLHSGWLPPYPQTLDKAENWLAETNTLAYYENP